MVAHATMHPVISNAIIKQFQNSIPGKQIEMHRLDLSMHRTYLPISSYSYESYENIVAYLKREYGILNKSNSQQSAQMK